MTISNKITLLLLTSTIILFTSCNKKETENLNIDFLIDNVNLNSLYLDYSEEELELYKNDPDKVFYAVAGHEVQFKTGEDALILDDPIWKLNDKIWDEPGRKYTFNHTFNVPGLYKVTLVVGKKHEVSKFVRVLEGKKGDNNLPKRESEVAGASQKALIEEKVDFVIDNQSPNKWEAILFTDVSTLNEPILRRVWDFGDGVVIPTSGSSVKYSYSKPGTYEVTLCLNLSSSCTKRKIVVRNKNAMNHIVNEDTNKRPIKKKKLQPAASSEKRKKAGHIEEETAVNINHKAEMVSAETAEISEISSVKLVCPTKGYLGAPLRFQDLSFPNEAIKYRTWYVNGEEQGFHQKSVDMIFDQPGEYEIKVCLNYLSKYCDKKTIEITDRKKKKNPKLAAPVGPISVPYHKRSKTPDFQPLEETPKEPSGFLCQAYGKVGADSEFKCSSDVEYEYHVSVVKIKPLRDIELLSAKIFGNTVGFVDMILSDEDRNKIAVLRKIQVLSGVTTVEFAEFAMLLKEGQNYELTISTIPQKSKKQDKLGLLNSTICNIPTIKSDWLDVQYLDGKITLYDIKYCY